jgi:uncharacterized repeat protein (TIGR03803 family)
MKKTYSVRTIILAGSLLLQLGTLRFRSRGTLRTPRPANPELNGRRAALCIAALIAALGLIPAGRVMAQTFTVLHSFTALASGTNSDGVSPRGRLITDLSGNRLYGTAVGGGSSGYGTVFAVNTDGTGFTTLHSFNFFSGSQPLAGLILSGNTLYGTAQGGGSPGFGTVFKVNTDGTGFTTLHNFSSNNNSPYTNSDGSYPYAGLVLSGNTLYGTASKGGSSANGTVFKVNTNGTGFTTLHSFTATFDPDYTNSDGRSPIARLILSGDTLYGTANQGGGAGRGTVFALNTDGTGFTTLHSFTPAQYDPVSNPGSTNSDGVNPLAELILLGNTLYGTASHGGNFGDGTVFALNTNGTGFTALHSFAYFSDGRVPGGLILSGNTLYGTAANGGSLGEGTMFALSTDGTGFTTLHSFASDSAGGVPGGLILSGNTLYGPAYLYGGSDEGTLFSLSFAPQLTIIPSGANVVLMWLTNFVGFDYTGFTLQSTTNLFPTAWSPVVQPAVTNAGQISVTVPTTDGRNFFRLKSQ